VVICFMCDRMIHLSINESITLYNSGRYHQSCLKLFLKIKDISESNHPIVWLNQWIQNILWSRESQICDIKSKLVGKLNIIWNEKCHLC
jgi:hypothetical protein